MSAKRLRSKLNPKFFLPLSTSTNRQPTSARPSGGVLGITADFSDKMFRREPKSAPLPPPPPPPKDISGGERERSYSFFEPHNPRPQSEWDDVRYAVMSPISESDDEWNVPTPCSPDMEDALAGDAIRREDKLGILTLSSMSHPFLCPSLSG